MSAAQPKRKRKAVKTAIARRADVSLLNSYLQTLVDPEKYKGVRYPDEYTGLTATLQGLLNVEMFYFQADSALLPSAEPPGFYFHVFSPTMTQPVLEYAMLELPVGAGLSMIANSQTDEIGLFPLVEDTSTPSTCSGQMQLVSNGPLQNVSGEFSWTDQTFATPAHRFTDPSDGSVAYGVPFTARQAGGIVAAVFEFVSGTQLLAGAGGDSLSVQYVNAAGTTVSTVVPVAATGYNVRATSDVTSLLAPLLDGLSFAAALPGIAVRVGILSAPTLSRSISVLSCSVYFNIAGSPYTNRYHPLEFPDVATYSSTIDKYRLVSASAWVEYQGSDLQNGGQHAALYYGGGNSPMRNGLWSYASVAETPGSYQGALKLGSYSIWKPSDPRDMLFRNLTASSRWGLPYIIDIGFASTPTQVDALRLRVPANFEFVSTSQFYNYQRARPDPVMLDHANQFLRDFPTSMENPLHLAAIRDILKKAMNAASSVGKWIGDNRSWLLPAASAVGTLLL